MIGRTATILEEENHINNNEEIKRSEDVHLREKNGRRHLF